MTDLKSVVAGLYAQVGAPGWASPNLDALADVLRDLSWRAEGPVPLVLPDLRELDPDDATRLMRVLVAAELGSSGTARPVRLTS